MFPYDDVIMFNPYRVVEDWCLSVSDIAENISMDLNDIFWLGWKLSMEHYIIFWEYYKTSSTSMIFFSFLEEMNEDFTPLQL